MSTTLSIEIPREIVHAAKMNPDALRRELAVHLFPMGKLSFGKARAMAGMSFWEFQQLLGIRKIVVHYDLREYEEDSVTLRKLGRL